MDGWKNGWMDELVDGWMDGKMEQTRTKNVTVMRLFTNELIKE